MNPSEASFPTQLKVGIFTLLGLALIGVITVVVNDRPYWWRHCQVVHINVEDATGLKTKSPVRSLGLEIGYIQSVLLSDTHVDLGICITERVDVLPTTRAYIRGEGFLGDKFVELKPVRYVGPGARSGIPSLPTETLPESTRGSSPKSSNDLIRSPWIESWVRNIGDFLIPSVFAEDIVESAEAEKRTARQIPVGEGSQDIQNLVKRVDSLVGEMTNLTTHLKQAINPDEMRSAMHQLNRTLENASRTLSPESGLNQTAQRTLAKLEDAIEQLRDMMTRVNQGQGSVGMLINDPSYADELREMIRNANKLLGKVDSIRFVPDVGGEKIQGYDTGRGWFRLAIWPKPDRYYLLGISLDPRGGQTIMRTTSNVPNGPQTIVDTLQVEKTRLLLTGMLGKIFFDRLDLSIGALNGDGAVSTGLFMGPKDDVERIQLRTDLYSRGTESLVNMRLSLMARVFMGAYLRVGVESFREINGVLPVSVGAGVTFSDDDIKLLFALR